MSFNTIFNKSFLAAMSLISIIVFLIILLVTTVKTDTQNQPKNQVPNVQNFKEFVTKMINEQSAKIQMLFKKIQTNAHNMLQTIQSIKRNSKTENLKSVASKNANEVESTIEKSLPLKGFKRMATEVGRNFNTHYTTTGYGHSGSGGSHGHTGNANYGAPTYHHHSIGFDPINIVVSMSLLSFLLQAIQGLLSRTRTPTPVVEARSLDLVQEWLRAYREKNFYEPNIAKFAKHPKKKNFKKYVH